MTGGKLPGGKLTGGQRYRSRQGAAGADRRVAVRASPVRRAVRRPRAALSLPPCHVPELSRTVLRRHALLDSALVDAALVSTVLVDPVLVDPALGGGAVVSSAVLRTAVLRTAARCPVQRQRALGNTVLGGNARPTAVLPAVPSTVLTGYVGPSTVMLPAVLVSVLVDPSARRLEASCHAPGEPSPVPSLAAAIQLSVTVTARHRSRTAWS